MNNHTPKLLIFGAGPVGATVGGWIAAAGHPQVYFLDQGAVAEGMKQHGLTLYQGGAESTTTQSIQAHVIDRLADCCDADVVVLAVKNYSLDTVAGLVKAACGDRPIIVGLQNGVENQTILPKYFSRVLYGVIGYNAWMDAPGKVGYQKRGPVVLGTPDNSLQEELATVAALFGRGVETVVTNHLADVVHSKLVINLTNSVTTLIGHGLRPVSSVALLQRLLSNVLYEGVCVVKAAGFKECKIGGMPPWALLRASATLPQFLTRPLFKKNLAKMVMSSMAQDVIQRKAGDSELETINGYIVRLAEQTGTPAPYNRAIYALCRQEFAKPGFEPMDVKAVWAHVEKHL
jgi:2-dehydropantoate 2-reductase